MVLYDVNLVATKCNATDMVNDEHRKRLCVVSMGWNKLVGQWRNRSCMIRETLLVVAVVVLGMVVSYSVECVRSVRELQMDNSKSSEWVKEYAEQMRATGRLK